MGQSIVVNLTKSMTQSKVQTGIHEKSLLLGPRKKSLTLNSNPIWDFNGDKQNKNNKPVSNHC